MLKREAIQKFLATTNSPIAQLYDPSMEVQVNVAKDNGVHHRGEYKGKSWRGWRDQRTGEIWKNFRIPWNADHIPEYVDSKMTWDLLSHVEGIGMTGWDWENKVSKWVGYDFDSITNHKEGLDDSVLDQLIAKTGEIPWVTLLRSTSGKGIHLYLFFDKPFPTNNHTEHSALARSMLSMLTVETGFNFKSTVDCVGSVLWCYHRKQEGTNGLTYIKTGDPFPIEKIPKNWAEHIPVVNRKMKKTHSNNKGLETLASAMRSYALDDQHQEILQWFSKSSERDWWWNTDYNMLVCHTLDLKKCHTELRLKGIFETATSGSSSQNCFAFPSRSGSFVVRRHGKNVNEAQTWIKEDTGWTKCTFNSEPTFHDACVSQGGLENAKGEYVFNNCGSVTFVLSLLDIKFEYPDRFEHRRCSLKKKGSKIVIQVERDNDDPRPAGFLNEKKYWVKVVSHHEESEEVPSNDNLIRHVVSQGSDAGWYIKINDAWVFHPKTNVVSVLVAQMVGFKRNEIEQMMGKSILDPWSLVNHPFQDEYMGDRKWNKDAAQLAFRPVQGKTETWWSLFEHLGSGLDEAVESNEWCKMYNIGNGAEYLFIWLVSMIQRPLEPLPYLFLFGEQKNGKSTLHEAVTMLFKNGHGVVRADKALGDKSGFNAELANAVLCVVEETDLGRNKSAANKMKDWVTGKTISIRGMFKNAYDIRNSTHWIQCANYANYIPLFRGDTRITVVEVGPLEREVPKKLFMEMLEAEAPALMYEVLNYDLPEPESRLGIPCLESSIKDDIMINNYNLLERFLKERTKVAMGHLCYFDDLYQHFRMWLAQTVPTGSAEWTKRETSLHFPRTNILVKAVIGSDNKTAIGNLSLDLEAEDKDVQYVVNEKRRLSLVPRKD